MSFLGKFFNRKPLEGLLEINERVLAFDYCFNTDVMEDDEFKVYLEGIVEQLHDDFPEASFMVFDFRGGKGHTLIDDVLSNYDMTVVDYPRQYQDCPLLALETIYHFLKSSESWLSVGEHNMLLMNCERSGWPILAFVLSALVLYMKRYNGERKTLDMIYKLGPSELLPLMSPLNPIPSQVRYLQYVSRRNVGTQWPPLDRQLLLDCVILRVIPQFDGAGGCRPIFKVYGQDPFVATNRTPKVLFSTPKKGKPVRHYKQEDCPLVKIDIRCHVQGDVVVECINLDDDMEHEEMIFRAMFNTAFLRSNILMLNRNDIDMFWHCQDRFAKEFRAEILFSEMDAATTPVSNEVRGFEEKGLPMEAFAKVQEIFSNVDLLDTKTEIALDVLQQIDQSTVLQEKLETGSSISVEAGNLLLKIVPENFQENQASPAESRTPEKMSEWKQSTPALKLSIDVKDSEPQEQVGLSQSKIISQRMPQTAVSPDSNSYQSEPSSLGITTVLHDLGASNSDEAAHLVTTDSSPSSSSIVPISNTSVKPGTIGIIEGSTPTPTVSMSMKSHSLGPLVEDPTGLAKNPVTQLSSKASSPTVLDVDNSLSTPLPRPTLPKTSGPSAPPSSGSMPSSTDLPSKGTTPLPPTVQAPSANTGPSSAAPPRHRTRSTGRSPTRPSFSTRRPPPSGLLDASSTPSPPSNNGQSAPSKRSSQMLMKSFSTSGQAPPTQPPVARSASGRVADSPTPPPPPPALTRASSSRIDPQPPPPPPPSSSHASPSRIGPPPPPPGSSKVAAPPPPPSRTGSVSGPPGPPGPPGMLTRGRTITRVSSSKDPGRPNLKPYHWLKLPRAMQGSLWDETQKSDESSLPPEIDLSELESFFSVASAKRKGKGGKSAEAAAPKSEKVQLVDLRRAYICEIMLSKVKTPLPELVNSVLAMDDSALDIDQIENLIKFCPTKEERETLKNYTGDKDKLGKCEHLFYELMKVPRMEAKLRVFSFKLQFTSQASDLRDSLNIVNSAADEIKNSTKLKRVMQTILSLGNALNHGTARGSAIGFRLDSLLKLTDTRARKSKMTLMHYLCKVIAKEMPEILDFPQDLGSLEAATKIQLKYLAEEMQAISKGLEKVEQELTGSENDGAVSEGFCKLLRGFLGYAEADVRSLTKIYSVVGRNADALARYFGEDPARCPFEQVVATLNVFAKTFTRAHTENVKQMELVKKKEQKDAENKTMTEKNEAE